MSEARGEARIGILTGPTATGKTALAIELAEAARARGVELEIVNADSLLVYRGMDVGTAKPTADERARVPHHLIDVRDPDGSFTAGDYARAATSLVAELAARGRRALFVGGTGFYLKALLYGMWDAPPADPAVKAELERLENAELHGRLRARDPAAAARIGPNDRYRLVRAVELLMQTGKGPTELKRAHARPPDPRLALWVIDRPTPELHERIEARTAAMLAEGLVEETRALAASFPGARPLKSVGYAQVLAHLAGEAPAGRRLAPGEAGLRDEISLATRQLVKRQRTWFRGERSARHFLLDIDRAALAREFHEIYAPL